MTTTQSTTTYTFTSKRKKPLNTDPYAICINLSDFIEALGYTMDDYAEACMEDNDLQKEIFHKGIEYTIDAILNQTNCVSKFYKTSSKGENAIGCVHWEHKSVDYNLDICLLDASLIYIVHISTDRCDGQLRNVYFYYDGMSADLCDLVMGISLDFTAIIRAICKMKYLTIESDWGRKDMQNFSRRERFLLRKRHYYDGNFYYENGRKIMPRMNHPWNKWTTEIFERM